MVVKKCDKCLKRYRTSKEKEPLCAKCTVDNLPAVEDVAKMEAEFNGFAEEIYGMKVDLTSMPQKVFNVDNIFNHETRLNALKELNEKEKTYKSTKERQKASREVNRLLDENAAIHDRLRVMKDRLMGVLMLAATIKQPDAGKNVAQVPDPALNEVPPLRSPKLPGRSPDGEPLLQARDIVACARVINARSAAAAAQSPDVAVVVLKKKESFNIKKEADAQEPQPGKQQDDDELMPLLRTNSVKNRIQELQKATQANRVQVENDPAAKVPISATKNNSMSVTITCRLQKANGENGGAGDAGPDLVDNKVKVKTEIVDAQQSSEPEEDELTPLQRSNSVRNRIQAFEALSRRASTGTWDRGADPRRKLNF